MNPAEREEIRRSISHDVKLDFVRIWVITLILLILLIAGVLIAGARDVQVLDKVLVPTFNVRTDLDRVATYGRFLLYVESQIVGLNETGNQTLVPNTASVNVSMYDVNHDVVIREFTVPLFVGTAAIVIVVEPIWTSTVVNITVRDFVNGLQGYAIVETFMSDEYLVYLFRVEFLSEFRTFQREIRAAADSQIWIERILMGSFTGITTFLFFVLFVRADHHRSRRGGYPSYFDRSFAFIWPFSMVPDDFPVWIDPSRTWDAGAAKHWIARRRAWSVQRLQQDAEELQREIADLLSGRLGP